MQVDASGKPLALMAVFRLYQYLSNLDMSWQQLFFLNAIHYLLISYDISFGR